MKQAFLPCLLTLAFLLSSPKQAFAFVPGLTATLSDDQIVYARPNDKLGGYFPDSKFSTFTYNNKLYGVIPGTTSYTTPDGFQPVLQNINAIGIYPTAGSFDSHGTWVSNIYDIGGNLYLFYNGDNDTPISPTMTKQLCGIGYATSTNSGSTWNKSPNRLVGGTYKLHACDEDVKIIGNYFYMWFSEATSDSTTNMAVARSPLSSFGKPGTWLKYYCDGAGCDFKEPGVGGRSTDIAIPDDPAVSYNTYLGKYIAIGCGGATRCYALNDNQSRPLSLSVSDDLINGLTFSKHQS